jgi:hypothetical protein
MVEKFRREQNNITKDWKCPIGGFKNKDHVFSKAKSLREHLKTPMLRRKDPRVVPTSATTT